MRRNISQWFAYKHNVAHDDGATGVQCSFRVNTSLEFLFWPEIKIIKWKADSTRELWEETSVNDLLTNTVKSEISKIIFFVCINSKIIHICFIWQINVRIQLLQNLDQYLVHSLWLSWNIFSNLVGSRCSDSDQFGTIQRSPNPQTNGLFWGHKVLD